MSPDTVVEELAKTIARFKKATKLCDILEGEGVTYEQSRYLDTDAWELVIHAARLESASVISRQLTLELLRDRDERKMRG